MSIAPPSLDDPFVLADGMSTDYLNRFGEVLMLIEMASDDRSLLDDLKGWRAVSYEEHFRTSNLRCAAPALAAYAALDTDSRGAFESLCGALNRLTETVLLTIEEIPDPDTAKPVIDVAVQAYRSLLSRATGFIGSGGDRAMAAYDPVDLQDTIDQMMAA